MSRQVGIAIALLVAASLAALAQASAATPPPQEPAALQAACSGSAGPGIPAPASPPSGVPGFHAQWHGQSGYPTLCPGERSTAVVAYLNSGTAGWTRGVMGQAAFLGTWGHEPGQDRPSPLGGDGTNGSPATGWPRYNRIAAQSHEWIGPGQVAWFQFTIQAPEAPGHYRLYLRPLIEGATWMEDFGVYWSVKVLQPDGSEPPPPPIACEQECWPFTGIRHQGGPVSRPAFNVRIDNAVAARPHYGISQADMVFEVLVEGRVTRLAAIFHSQDPVQIGSVRSARLSDRYITPMTRGALVYSGATIEETDLIKADARAGIYHDLNANYASAGYYRVGTRRAPHDMMVSSGGVRDALARLGATEADVPRWDFLNDPAHEPAIGGFGGAVRATELTIPYRSAATVRYAYDGASRTYARWQHNGAAFVREIDDANGAAVAAKNVVVIHTDIWETDIIQDIYRSRGLDMRLTGQGRATVFRDGLRQEGTWSRATVYDAFELLTSGGELILLAPGQTWIHVVPDDWAISSG